MPHYLIGVFTAIASAGTGLGNLAARLPGTCKALLNF
jgi:hypothetical protein